MGLATVGNKPPTQGFAEYVWVDGPFLRSKTRLIHVHFDDEGFPLPDIPRWHADDNLLTVCHGATDPLRPAPSFVILCEQRDKKDRCVTTRARLRDLIGRGAHRLPIRLGFRQAFDHEFKHALTEELLRVLADAGLCYHSSGEGWFQLQFEAHQNQENLVVCDYLLLARHLLERIALAKNEHRPHWKGLTLLIDADDDALDLLRPHLLNPLHMPPHVVGEVRPYAETETGELDPYLLAIHALGVMGRFEKLDS